MKYRICKYYDGIHKGYCIQGKPWWSFGIWLYARRVTDNEISVYRTLNEAKMVLKRLQTKIQITALEQKDK